MVLISRRWLDYIYFVVQLESSGLKCCYVVEDLFRVVIILSEDSLWLLCSVFQVLERCWMVWLSLLITTIFLNLCNCSLTYRNRVWNNFLKTAVLFHAVSRERLCVCFDLSSSRGRIRMEPVPSWSCSQAVSKPVWHIPLLCVQWKTRDDGQRNCPKHVEFYSKNKFEKLVHLVGFITRMPKILYE